MLPFDKRKGEDGGDGDDMKLPRPPGPPIFTSEGEILSDSASELEEEATEEVPAPPPPGHPPLRGVFPSGDSDGLKDLFRITNVKEAGRGAGRRRGGRPGGSVRGRRGPRGRRGRGGLRGGHKGPRRAGRGGLRGVGRRKEARGRISRARIAKLPGPEEFDPLILSSPPPPGLPPPPDNAGGFGLLTQPGPAQVGGFGLDSDDAFLGERERIRKERAEREFAERERIRKEKEEEEARMREALERIRRRYEEEQEARIPVPPLSVECIGCVASFLDMSRDFIKLLLLSSEVNAFLKGDGAHYAESIEFMLKSWWLEEETREDVLEFHSRPFVRKIKLYEWRAVRFPDLSFLSSFPHLVDLCLNNMKGLTDADLEQIPSSQLLRFRLSSPTRHPRTKRQHLTGRFLSVLSFPRLELLSLPRFGADDDESRPQVQILPIPKMRDLSICLEDFDIQLIAKLFGPKLIRLVVHADWSKFSDEDQLSFFHAFVRLESLQIAGKFLPDWDVLARTLGKTLQKLRFSALSVVRTEPIDSALVSPVSASSSHSFEKLTELSFYGILRLVLEELVNKKLTPQLKNLIIGSGQFKLNSSPFDAQEFPNLRSLMLRGANFKGEGIDQLVPSLRSLDLGGGGSHRVTVCSFKNSRCLESLTVSQSGLQNEDVVLLPASLRLFCASRSSCGLGLRCLPSQLPNLQSLHLSSLSQLDLSCLDGLSIRNLSISDCPCSGGQEIETCEAGYRMPNLKMIRFSSVKFDIDKVLSLVETLETAFIDRSRFTGSGFSRSRFSLKTLSLGNCWDFQDAGLENLVFLHRLRLTRMRDVKLSCLGKLESLQHLELHFDSANPPTFPITGSALKTVTIYQDSEFNLVPFAPEEDLPNLAWVSVRGCRHYRGGSIEDAKTTFREKLVGRQVFVHFPRIEQADYWQ